MVPRAVSRRETIPDAREGLSMIFRQFLTPKTGCASYVFG
jgi:hypothetical protein